MMTIDLLITDEMMPEMEGHEPGCSAVGFRSVPGQALHAEVAEWSGRAARRRRDLVRIL